MAVFTIPLKDAVELEPLLVQRALTQYPIFNEEYRPLLNQKILDHYWFREIGHETISMFEFALRRKMNEIMPLYNDHYKTSLRAEGIDPLTTMRVNSESNSEAESEGSSSSDTDSTTGGKSRGVASEFPQTRLSANGDYASSSQDNVTESKVEAKAAEESRNRQKGRQANQVTGSQGQASVLLFQHRQTLVNVDLMVLNELDELFMGLWSNGDKLANNTVGVGFYGFPGIR